MPRYLYIILFVCFSQFARAADTTLIEYVHIEFYGAQDRLPNYFLDSARRGRMLDALKETVKQGLSSEQAVFLEGKQQLQQDEFSLGTKRPSRQYPARYFLRVEGKVSYPMTFKKNKATYFIQLSLKAIVRDKRGKVILRKKTRQKTEVHTPKGIYRQELISGQAFEKLFDNSLHQLFSLTSSPQTTLQIQWPQEYPEFTKRALLFRLTEKKTRGFFRSRNEYEITQKKNFLSGSIKLQLGGYGQKPMVLLQRKTKERIYKLSNSLSQQAYNLHYTSQSDKASKEGSAYRLNFLQEEDIKASFYMEADSSATDHSQLRETAKWRWLKGHWQEEAYRLAFHQERQLTAVFQNERLIALIQQSPESRFHRRRTNAYHLYLEPSKKPRQEAARIMNLWLAFRLGHLGEFRQANYGN